MIVRSNQTSSDGVRAAVINAKPFAISYSLLPPGHRDRRPPVQVDMAQPVSCSVPAERERFLVPGPAAFGSAQRPFLSSDIARSELWPTAPPCAWRALTICVSFHNILKFLFGCSGTAQAGCNHPLFRRREQMQSGLNEITSDCTAEP
jgi:hypothetical protein